MTSRLYPLVHAFRILIFTVCGSFSISTFATTNSWVYFDSPGHLSYRTWSNGNRIMDFSSSGYMGGGVAIPTNVATVVTVNPSGGDDTAAIKSAISTVAGHSLVNGIRGAVQLAKGTFHVSSQINLNASGVIVRGVGSTNGTTIVMTGGTPFKLFNMSGSGSPSESGTVNITGSYVASGTNGFNVSSASGFSVGNSVIIHRVVTTSWINFMGMQPGGSGGLDAGQTWIDAGTDITTDRKITAISGNHITLDAPVADSFDTAFLGSPSGTVAKYSWSGRISQVGLEHLRVQAPAANEAYIAVNVDNIIDSWVRDVTIQDGVNSFTVQNGAKRVTVDGVNITRTVAISSSAPPWDYSCSGTQILYNKCQSHGTGVWPFLTAGESTGPVVLLNFFSTENGGISPHQRWSTALLSDNCSLPNAPSGTQGISYRNRANHGSGQGWTTGWSVAWNVVTPFFLVSAAPGTENWCIGGVGAKTSTSDPDGIYDQLGSIVTPRSLYLEQLKERLGGQAVENIGYPMFTISATPSSQSVNAGSTATFTVNVADPTLMSNVVALSVSGLPAGATAQFSPASVQGKDSSTLTIDTSTSTPAGTYTVTITGSSASLQHSTTVSLTVTASASPDFSLSASPGSLTVAQGNSGTSTITETDLNGFNGSVTLSASGLPNGVTAAFSPNPITGTSTLTLTASSTAAIGTAAITLTGTSGSLQRTTTVGLTVNGGPLPGGWTDADVGAVGLAGNAGYSSGTFIIGGGGSDIWNAADQFHYAYQSVSGDTTIIARVVSEDGTDSYAKAGVMIRESTADNAVEASVLITPTNGVAMEIRPTTAATSINVTGWITGVKPAQWVKLVRLGDTFTGYYSADGSTWTQIAATNVTMNSSATAGLAVTAHDNASLNTATFDNVSMTIPDFSLSASPGSLTVIQGNNGTSTITETDLNSFNGSVTLSASGLPNGVTAAFVPNPTTSTSTLTLSASSSATIGTATVTVTGVSGSLTHTTTVSLTVNPAPDFSISASPSSQAVTAGNSTSYTATIGSLNGFSGNVSLSVTGLPSNSSAGFTPASISGSGNSTLTVSTTPGTPVGTYTLTISGASGSLNHPTTVSLTVDPAPDFSLSASPGSLTVVQGANGTSTVTVNPINGFSGSVNLSASGLPPGVTASFNPASTTSSSTLTLTASATATTGTAMVTITGVSGPLTRTTPLTLTVNASSTGALPSGWTDIDIGAVGIAGSAGYNAGTFTVGGAGSDIWNSGDQFNYVYQSVLGDQTVIARVVSENGVHPFAKAGVMIRETLATNSVEASVLVTSTNGVALEIRPATGAASINVMGWLKGPVPPQWVKLVRSGNTFTASCSADGSTWTQIAVTNVTMAAGATAGLVVTAHDTASLNTAAFDNVSIVPAINTTAIYQVQNMASGLVLNDQGGSLTNGSKITQWSSVSSDNLRWRFIPTSNGYYQVNSVKSGLDAVVQSASTANGAGIIQWSFGAAGNDQWKPVHNSDGSYTFFNLHSGLVLEDPGSSTATSTQMDQSSSNGGSNQKWNLILQ